MSYYIEIIPDSPYYGKVKLRAGLAKLYLGNFLQILFKWKGGKQPRKPT